MCGRRVAPAEPRAAEQQHRERAHTSVRTHALSLSPQSVRRSGKSAPQCRQAGRQRASSGARERVSKSVAARSQLTKRAQQLRERELLLLPLLQLFLLLSQFLQSVVGRQCESKVVQKKKKTKRTSRASPAGSRLLDRAWSVRSSAYRVSASFLSVTFA